MQISILLIAGAKEGYGHVYRVAAVLSFLQRCLPNARVVLCYLNAVDDGAKAATQILYSRTGLSLDVVSISEFLDSRWEICVSDCLDHFETLSFSPRHVSNLWVAIDAIGVEASFADLRLNPLYPSKGAYNGLAYSLFDRSLTAIKKNYHAENIGSNKYLLVSQGGADAHNLVNVIVNHLLKILPDTIPLKILPGVNTNIKLLNAEIRPCDLVLKANSDKKCIFSDVRAVISSGGLLMTEACFIGFPVIVISNESKELKTITSLVSDSFIYDYFPTSLNLLEDITRLDFLDFFSFDVSKKFYNNSKMLSDNNGWDLLKNSIRSFYEAG